MAGEVETGEKGESIIGGGEGEETVERPRETDLTETGKSWKVKIGLVSSLWSVW